MSTQVTMPPTSNRLGASAIAAPREPRIIPSWWRDASIVVAWGLGLFVVALWVTNGGIAGLTSTSGVLDESGRLTGLIASYLLLLQVLLMARVPFVEQAFGQDGLTRLHRWFGFSSFTLMLAHIALITFGYAADAHQSIWGQIVDFTLTYPAMLLALAGTVALCLVVVTSIKPLRPGSATRSPRSRALRYESWHLLHLYAYLGVGLALPHQLWTGRDFLASPVATTFWWALYAAVALTVIVFRVLLPLARTQRAGLRVTHVEEIAPGVVNVSAVGRATAALDARAGQFLPWRFGGPGVTRANPYSLSAAPRVRDDGQVELRFTAAMIGDGSRRLSTLTPGTRVLVEGPYGRMHTGAARTRASLLIGAGIGITPLRALLDELPSDPATGRLDATVIHRHSTDGDLVLDDEIEAITAARGGQYIVLRGHRIPGRESWLPEDHRHLSDADALLLACPDVRERDVYVCGGAGWMRTVERALREIGVPREQIHVEHFTY